MPKQRGPDGFGKYQLRKRRLIRRRGEFQRGTYSPFFSFQVLTTYFVASSPREATAFSFVTLEPSAKTTVTTWVSASSPFSMEMDLKPSRLLNAELTSFLQPPQTTPVIPATYDTSPPIAVVARATTANVMDTISFFILFLRRKPNEFGPPSPCYTIRKTF